MINVDKETIEKIIRSIILEQLQEEVIDNYKKVDESGIALIKTNLVETEKFDTGNKNDEVYLKDVLTDEESSRLGCGIMEMKESSFEWTLKYDEIDYIIEGRLEVVIDDKIIVGEKGDIIYIPKDSSIKFSCPSSTKFLYVVYPSNWKEL